jgi:hypothetical protein
VSGWRRGSRWRLTFYYSSSQKLRYDEIYVASWPATNDVISLLE